jgi:hypothetical protein
MKKLLVLAGLVILAATLGCRNSCDRLYRGPCAPPCASPCCEPACSVVEPCGPCGSSCGSCGGAPAVVAPGPQPYLGN